MNVGNSESYMLTHAKPDLPTSGHNIVSTSDGDLKVERGEAHGASWLRARGIQYSELPIKDKRFQPPVPQPPWSGVRDATKWGDDCVNAPFMSRIQSIQLSAMSESCL